MLVFFLKINVLNIILYLTNVVFVLLSFHYRCINRNKKDTVNCYRIVLVVCSVSIFESDGL